jgi:hypothetical protein
MLGLSRTSSGGQNEDIFGVMIEKLVFEKSGKFSIREDEAG